MKFMYSLLIIIEIVLMGICAVKSFGKKGKLAEIVLYYETVAFVCGIFFWLYAFYPDIKVTTFCKGAELACSAYVLYAVFYRLI